METSNDSDTIESENRPALSIDLSEIIINAVTKFKSSTLKNNKRKENLNSHVAFVRKVKEFNLRRENLNSHVALVAKIRYQFTVIIVTFGFTKSVRVFQMMYSRS